MRHNLDPFKFDIFLGGLLARYGASGWQAYAYDANGNVTDGVDFQGDLVAHYEYDAFGNPIAPSGDPADTNPYRFSTKYLDETGLYYYGYRFYSPAMGRWINRDPMEEKIEPNLYAFIRNCPVDNIDALGLIEGGIISIGEIPGVAEKLNILYAKLLKKSITVSGGSVKKTEFISWLAKVRPEVFIQLYAQVIYDELQRRLENVVRNLGVCYVVNLDAASLGTGEIQLKEYSFPAMTQPWTWNTAPTIKRTLKYEPCPDSCCWRVFYDVPISKDFSTWKEVERFSCVGSPRCINRLR